MIKDEKYYNGLDKRTREYKEHSKGLGDTVEKVLKKTGIAKVAKFLLGEDCGCDEKKKMLNEMYPHNVNCLKENEFNILKEYFEGNHKDIDVNQYRKLLTVYDRVTSSRTELSMGCPKCVMTIVEKLEKIYKTY